MQKFVRSCIAAAVLSLAFVTGAQAVTFEFEAAGTGGAQGTTVTGTFGYADSLVGQSTTASNPAAGLVFLDAELSDTGASSFRGQTVTFSSQGAVNFNNNAEPGQNVGTIGDTASFRSNGFGPSSAGFLVQLSSLADAGITSSAVLSSLPALSSFDRRAVLTINTDGSGREGFDLTSLSLVDATIPLPAGGLLLLTALGGLVLVRRRAINLAALVP